MKTFYFAVYFTPLRPAKFKQIEATSIAKAWDLFMSSTKDARNVVEGGGSKKTAIINFDGLNNRIWPRRVFIYKIGESHESIHTGNPNYDLAFN